MLKQVFTLVSVNSADIYLAASRVGKYPPLFISTSVNNYSTYTHPATPTHPPTHLNIYRQTDVNTYIHTYLNIFQPTILKQK